MVQVTKMLLGLAAMLMANIVPNIVAEYMDVNVQANVAAQYVQQGHQTPQQLLRRLGETEPDCYYECYPINDRILDECGLPCISDPSLPACRAKCFCSEKKYCRK